jgi:hypothetical protein
MKQLQAFFRRHDQLLALLATAAILWLILTALPGCAGARVAVGEVRVRPPVRVVLPPTPHVPAVEINIYEDKAIETKGPAVIKHYPNGQVVDPQPRIEPIPDPYGPQNFPAAGPVTRPRRERDAGGQRPEIGPPASTRELLIRGGLVIGVCLSVLLIVIAVKFRRPLATTLQNANLRDGLKAEASELLTLVKQQLADEHRAKARVPVESKPDPPPAKPAAPAAAKPAA